MSILYIDGSAGISGNMLLGAYLDLGLPYDTLLKALLQIPIPSFELQVKTVYKNGIRGTLCEVLTSEKREEGHLNDFLNAISSSLFSSSQKELGIKIFKRLAFVEGKIHGVSLEEVHFHELGGWDTLIDVMGSVFALDWLDVRELIVGPLNVGLGWANTCHGKISVPAPATIELLKGFVAYSSGVEGELVTPTGALIASTLGSYGTQPPMRIKEIGYGAGTMNLQIPNCIRAFYGEKIEASDIKISDIGASGIEVSEKDKKVLVVECNIDDMNPEWVDHVMDSLYAKGALEVYLSPVQMKKNRPGILLSVITSASKIKEISQVLFLETTTLGVRFHEMSRKVLDRRIVEVKTIWGNVRVKEGIMDGEVINAAPEYEDLKSIAGTTKMPIKKINEEVLLAYKGHK